ncbi:MAG: hypothetical protein HOV94_00605 [Saccharothrix sp.]|nr:hypothetical protein [Saccharothrix sp.]
MNLRAVLDAVRAAGAGTGLDDIARDLGLRRDELDAAVEYRAHRGELVVAEVGGCPPVGCAGCHFRTDGCARPPKLPAITSRTPPSPGAGGHRAGWSSPARSSPAVNDPGR